MNRIFYSEFDGLIWVPQNDFKVGMSIDQMQPYRFAKQMAREGVRADRYAFECVESSFEPQGGDLESRAIAHQMATADLISRRIGGQFPAIYWCKSMIVQQTKTSRSYLSLSVWSHDSQPLAKEEVYAISEFAVDVARDKNLLIDEVVIWDNHGRVYWPEFPSREVYLVPDFGQEK